VVSWNTDKALRQFLASEGRGGKGALSHFVTETVRARILELEAEQAKAENGGLPACVVGDAIDEALEWARGGDALFPH
jgi:Ribbon-helix-helix domain